MESEVGQIAEAVEEDAEEASPGRAMRVAAALKAKGGDDFAKPGSIIEIKFVKGESFSLRTPEIKGATDLPTPSLVFYFIVRDDKITQLILLPPNGRNLSKITPIEEASTPYSKRTPEPSERTAA